MEQIIHFCKTNYDVVLVLGILIGFGILEVLAGHLKRTRRTSNDWIQEFGGFLVLSVLIKPLIVLCVFFIGKSLFGESVAFLKEWSLWYVLPFYLFLDDLLQYAYHRAAHEYEFLWKLHRPHHQAEEMGFFVSYRNAGLYYLLMPNIWWIGIVSFLGGASGVALGLVLKQFVIIGSHSTIRWDQALYKIPILKDLMYLVERIIVTPAFHYAHHGQSKLDGISDPNGNFGNMFSIWDQLFGTARFTRKFPVNLGLPNDPKEHWTAAYFYPLVHAKEAHSELSKNYQKATTASLDAITLNLKKGELYLWCQCGKSKQQPFCDGSHHGTKFKPILFEVKKDGKFRLCNCKHSKAAPFCDDTHLTLKKLRV